MSKFCDTATSGVPHIVSLVWPKKVLRKIMKDEQPTDEDYENIREAYGGDGR